MVTAFCTIIVITIKIGFTTFPMANLEESGATALRKMTTELRVRYFRIDSKKKIIHLK